MSLHAKIQKLNKLIFNQPVIKSNAVVWLQGDRLDRGPKALELYRRALAPKLVISGNELLIGRGIKVGENNISLAEMKTWLLKKGVKKTDIIVDNKSFNTRGQAVNIIWLAKKNNWDRIILVASWPYYQFRAFLTFLKAAEELRWNGQILNQFAVLKAGDKPGGRQEISAKLQKAEEAKLVAYKHHIAKVEQGIKYLMDFNREFALSFRQARLSDAKFLFNLRNEPEVRANSFSPEKIAWSAHKRWLSGVLKNKKRYLYIVINGRGKRMGQVRFDISGKQAEISIALLANFRGRGLGSKVIGQACSYFFNSQTQIKKIIAQIKAKNNSSIKAFAKAGFFAFKITKSAVHMRYV